MTTQVSFVGASDISNSSVLWFAFDKKKVFSVNSFNNGIMEIEVQGSWKIQDFAKELADCFDEESNFYGVRVIQFQLNGIKVAVTAENATPEEIIKTWEKRMRKQRIMDEYQLDEYMKTPQYQYKLAKALKADWRRQNLEMMLKQYALTVDLEFKNENSREMWKKFVAVNSEEAYGMMIIRYAEYWAKCMQYLMRKHEGVTVSKIALNASILADMEGISSSMYNAAVNILYYVWKYGDILYAWNNSQ